MAGNCTKFLHLHCGHPRVKQFSCTVGLCHRIHLSLLLLPGAAESTDSELSDYEDAIMAE